MFGRKKRAGPTDEAEALVAKFAARASQRSVAILKPQIPIGEGQSAGWFGGNAALPPGTPWPEEDGQKLLFLGQIDLSALPQDLWAGAGPRTGSLAIFLPAQWPHKPTVLHFDGPLAETKAPPPNSAYWTRLHNFDEPKTYALPKWPLIVETRPGNALHEPDIQGATQKPQRGWLLDPAYHPFNHETMSLLCTALDAAVTRLAREIVRFPAMKKLRPADAAWFERVQPTVLDTFVRFFEIEGRMRSAPKANPATIAQFVDELAQLNAYTINYLRDDGEGYCELVLAETKLLDRESGEWWSRSWWDGYEAGLVNHAIKAYTSVDERDGVRIPGSTKLPQDLRERVEAEWRRQTQRDGLAVMGYDAPIGISSPHGPDSPNEVLLIVYTSDLTGVIWGECYSLVLLIDRAALDRGDFSNVMFDITN